MSGGGNGYYRHPCIYRYSHNCPNWVWQNGDACGTCLAAGRPSKRDIDCTINFFPEVSVPLIQGGQVHYVTMTWDALELHLANPADNPLPMLTRIENHELIRSLNASHDGGRSWYCL
ncbi:hypothetical protein K432DRAFT_112897 [Lepidopterella palustris CBS 459.81]|uniref:Uncharacterized protein n=1 Tax=Lepidopterella palustris CBS 459.81 TaxID=1314670 RepID=A0A8E2JD73_9PEZI|nr:hypothetical protein K432DRAFT_112897 [Lepidopterella palustris CBS 459.81]